MSYFHDSYPEIARVCVLPQIMSLHRISKWLYVHTERWWKNWPSSVPFSLTSHCASLRLKITCKNRRQSLYHNPTYPHLPHAVCNDDQTLSAMGATGNASPPLRLPPQGPCLTNRLSRRNEPLAKPCTALSQHLTLLCVTVIA